MSMNATMKMMATMNMRGRKERGIKMRTMQYVVDGDRVIGRSVPQIGFRTEYEPQQDVEPAQEECREIYDEIDPLFVNLIPKRQITTAEVEMKIILLADQMGIPVKTLLKLIKREIG